MEVFLSWSGERSHKIASEFKTLLMNTYQESRPFISSRDIDKGTNWFEQLKRNISGANAGLIFFTHENTSSEWLHFEGGALTNSAFCRLTCPILFGLQRGSLGQPFSNFNQTAFEKTDILKLIVDLRKANLFSKVPVEIISSSFEVYWPRFQECVEAILNHQVPISERTKIRADEIEWNGYIERLPPA